MALIYFQYQLGDLVLLPNDSTVFTVSAIKRNNDKNSYFISNTDEFNISLTQEVSECVLSLADQNDQTTRPIAFTVTFETNDIAYIKHEAYQGRLRKVAIKSVNLAWTHAYDINKTIYPVWQDNLNEIWNNNALITYTQAMDIINNI